MTTPPAGRSDPGRAATQRVGRGSRHASTVMAEKLMSDDVERIVRSVLDGAAGGDMAAARIVMDRLVPVRKGAAIPMSIPVITTATDVDTALSKVTELMAAGEISPDEAGAVAGVIELRRKEIETNDLERRLRDVELKIGDR